jgi:hypothetical protein
MIAFELGIGIDFAGAVKEKQRRADNQLSKTWGNLLFAQDQNISYLVGRKGVVARLSRSSVRKNHSRVP